VCLLHSDAKAAEALHESNGMSIAPSSETLSHHFIVILSMKIVSPNCEKATLPESEK